MYPANDEKNRILRAPWQRCGAKMHASMLRGGLASRENQSDLWRRKQINWLDREPGEPFG